MSMVSEFKDFAMRGNVVDMAVGIVIGGAFGKIVSSFVADAVLMKYGVFIQTVIDFLIIAFAIFLVVKAMNSMKTKKADEPPPAPPGPSNEEVLLTEIRDALQKS